MKYLLLLVPVLMLSCQHVDYLSLYDKAIVETDNENYEQAIEYLNESIELNPDFDSAYAERAHDYLMTGQLDLALTDADKSLDMDRKNYSFRFTRGLIHFRLFNDEEAINDFSYIIDRKDSIYYLLALKERAYINSELEWYESAINDYTEYLTVDSLNADIFTWRGVAKSQNSLYWYYHDSLRALGESDAAFNKELNEKYFTEVIWDVRKFSSVFGCVMIDSSTCLKDFDKSIELNPNNSWVYYKKAEVLNQFKEIERSLLTINKAISIEQRSEYYEFRGLIYKQQEKSKLSLSDLDKAIELNPENETAIQNRKYLLEEQF